MVVKLKLLTVLPGILESLSKEHNKKAKEQQIIYVPEQITFLFYQL